MTHDANVPGTSLPKFTVNPVPTDRITSEHLSVLLERYRRGEDEPLIFGDGSRPEAAVIPFEVFVRLKMYDHAVSVREREEDAFQAEISDRVRAPPRPVHPVRDRRT